MRAGGVVAFLWAALSVSANAPASGDFVFGDDFDSSIPCPATPLPAIAGAMTPASRATHLGTSNYFFVKIRSCGYTGAVKFTAGGGPASWSLDVDPPSVSVADTTQAVALLTATIPTNGDAGNFTLKVDAQAANTVSLSSSLDVADEVWIVFRDGTGTDGAVHPFPPALVIRVGTKLRIMSEDTTAGHIIHAANGSIGYAHQSVGGSGVLPGLEYDLTGTGAGADTIFCHSHLGNSTNVTIQ